MKLLLAPFRKAEELEDETLKVSGVASTESVDSVGEIVKSAAIAEALPAYRKFPTLREMHSANAVGTVTDIRVEKGVTSIEAIVVDREAIRKVKHGVYRGFSIGGKVVSRDTKNPKVITKIHLSEVSIVDVPANRDSVLEIAKAAGLASKPILTADEIRAALDRMSPQEKAEVMARATLQFPKPMTTRDRWSF